MTRIKIFKAMLTHNMKEKCNGKIEIPDASPKGFQHFLEYIYTGYTELHGDIVIELLYLSK